MSKHGFSINSCNAKIRDGIPVLEQCFSPLGFASCLLSHTSLIPLSESREQQMLLYICCKAAWFISSACCGCTGPSSTAEFGSGGSNLPAGLDHAAVKRCPGAQGSAGLTSAFCPKHGNTSASSRADGFISIKLLRAITSHASQELPALVAPLSAAGAKGRKRLTFPAAQELLSAAKRYLAAVRGSSPPRCLPPSGDALCKFSFLARHRLWGCFFFFFITPLCTLTAFNALIASALLSGAIILPHSCRQKVDC